MQYTLKKLKVCMSHFMHKTIRGENISRMKEFSFQFVKHSLRYCGEHAEDTSEGSEIYCNFEISKHSKKKWIRTRHKSTDILMEKNRGGTRVPVA